MNKKLLLVLSMVCLLCPLLATPSVKQHMTIIAYPSTPFMMFSEDNVEGFSKDLLEELSTQLDFTYSIIRVNNVTELLNSIKTNKGDMGVASVSITSERENEIDFTHAFYDSGLDILVHSKHSSVLGTLGSFMSAMFSFTVAKSILAILVVLLVAAHIIWICERDKNIGISQSYRRGLFESLWWATVTVTTVGYGDKAPVSPIGRSFAMVWMFAGILFISLFTASVTTSMTTTQLESRIRGPQDLPGKLIGTVQGTTSEDYLHTIHAIPVLFPHIDDALASFNRGEIEGIVYDQPILKYYEITKGKVQCKVIGYVFDKQQYGIVLPQNSELREPLNQALLELKESGRYERLLHKWFK